MIYIFAKNEIDPTNGLGGFRENRTRSNSTEKLYLCHVELKIGNFHEYSNKNCYCIFVLILDLFEYCYVFKSPFRKKKNW